MFNEKAYRELVNKAIKEGGLSYKELSDGLKATTGEALVNFRDYTGMFWKRFPNRKYFPEDPNQNA